MAVELAAHPEAKALPAAASVVMMPEVIYSQDNAPLNLPVADEVVVPVVGYASLQEDVEEVSDAERAFQALESRAHSQHALISSDALRVMVRDLPLEAERNQKLDEIIANAKAHYPSEDGWVVLNLERLETLLNAEVEGELATTPSGVGSLAEAIALGDIEAAYVLIGRRPMLALADAAADFDALYRKRQGGEEEVSELLLSTLGARSDGEIVAVVKTLTSALDGTYTKEEDAVKVAIMKAVRMLS